MFSQIAPCHYGKDLQRAILAFLSYVMSGSLSNFEGIVYVNVSNEMTTSLTSHMPLHYGIISKMVIRQYFNDRIKQIFILLF